MRGWVGGFGRRWNTRIVFLLIQ